MYRGLRDLADHLMQHGLPDAGQYDQYALESQAGVLSMFGHEAVKWSGEMSLDGTFPQASRASLLTNAAGGTPGCNGIGGPDNVFYSNTYYAATMYAAEASLLNEQTAYPGSQNVMIILGDGDQNTPQSSGSTVYHAKSCNKKRKVSILAGRVRSRNYSCASFYKYHRFYNRLQRAYIRGMHHGSG